MKQKNFFAALAATMLLAAFASCSDNETLQGEGAIFNYYRTVPNENGTMTMVIDSVEGSIKSVDTPVSWLTVSDGGQDVNNHPQIKVSYKGYEPFKQREDCNVVIHVSNNATVYLHVCQPMLIEANTNSVDETFMNDWENQQTIRLATSNGIADVALPWSNGIANTSIPTDINFNVKKEDGWEMAFCTAGITEVTNANYFGLYNKYLGILRIFYYIIEPSDASNFLWDLAFGNMSVNASLYPFYNQLHYAIPSSHTSIGSLAGLPGSTNGEGMFSGYYSPFTSSNQPKALTTGWYACDVDMSAYNPDKQNTFQNHSGNTNFMMLSTRTWNDMQVTLSSDLTANIDASYQQPKTSTTLTSSKGLDQVMSYVSLAGTYFKDYKSTAQKVFEFFTKKTTQKKDSTSTNSDPAPTVGGAKRKVAVAALLGYLSTACSTANTLYTKFFKTNETTKTDGKITGLLNGKITTSGSIYCNKPNVYGCICLRPTMFKGHGHVGVGVWGLADDPVVYVASDRIFCTSAIANNFRASINSDGICSNNLASKNLRMISFFDPTQLKINLNTELFSEISNVNVTAYYGTYANEPATDIVQPMRDVIGLSNTEVLNLVDHSTSSKTISSSNWLTKLYQCDKSFQSQSIYDGSNLANTTVAMPDQPSSGSITGLVYNVEGAAVKGDTDADAEKGDKCFIVDPVVSVPYSETTGQWYDSFPLNKFVVVVEVSFTAKTKESDEEQLFTFSHRFLPRIEKISGDNLKQKYNSLNTYASDCAEGNYVGTIANDKSLRYYNFNGDRALYKTLSVLKWALDDSHKVQ